MSEYDVLTVARSRAIRLAPHVHSSNEQHASQPRDPSLWQHYLDAAWRQIPRLLGAIDRNPYRPTYGCFDRQFWHYRTASFPSEMYQEAVLPLAIAFARDLPGNRWHGQSRVFDLAVAALRFSTRTCHRDGSCDDYYPFERALGAAVFSFAAATEAFSILAECEPTLRHDDELLSSFRLRAAWIIDHEESGYLTNHHALAALGLARAARLLNEPRLATAAEAKVHQVLTWQSPEGWFDEYGGADPGYQTVTIDCLAKYRLLTGAFWLAEPLRSAVAFCRHFLHPDGSYGGEYGSRGTYHFYTAGFEILAEEFPDAADLADGHLFALAAGTIAAFEDDRMVGHYTGNLLEAALHWSPARSPSVAMRRNVYFPQAKLLVRHSEQTHTVISAARGGVFKHFAPRQAPVTDAGLIVEFEDGRVAVSQFHDTQRETELENGGTGLTVEGDMYFCRWETATPVKQAVFHVGMGLIGRWCRTLVRRLLQRKLITGRKTAPIYLKRKFQFSAKGDDALTVIDEIRLTHPNVNVRRMSFGVDHQAAYVAAANVYQESVLEPWAELKEYVPQLNRERCVTVVRRYPHVATSESREIVIFHDKMTVSCVGDRTDSIEHAGLRREQNGDLVS